MTVPPHPAVFSDDVLDIAVSELAPIAERKLAVTFVLDPFAGVGRVHELAERIGGVITIGIELEPRWAAATEHTTIGDATQLNPTWTDHFDAVVTSPCYGNRMADHHNAADKCKECGGDGSIEDGEGFGGQPITVTCPKCKGTGRSHRRSYRHYLGEELQPNNAGAMAWGDEYRALHAKAWAEVHRVLRPGGMFLLNIKDHIRNGKRVRVSAWHRRTTLDLGFVELGRWDIPTSGYGFGMNNTARVPNEHVYVFTKEQR